MTVIFVCTGNTCRSPLAEGLARKLAADRGLTGLTFMSAGTGAFEGSPPSDGSILVGLERGVDLSEHRSRSFSSDLLDHETIVLGMSSSHVTAIREVAPKARVYLIDEFASNGASRKSISDPFGGDLEGYRRTADQISAMLPGVLNRLVAEAASEA